MRGFTRHIEVFADGEDTLEADAELADFVRLGKLVGKPDISKPGQVALCERPTVVQDLKRVFLLNEDNMRRFGIFGVLQQFVDEVRLGRIEINKRRNRPVEHRVEIMVPVDNINDIAHLHPSTTMTPFAILRKTISARQAMSLILEILASYRSMSCSS